MVIAYLRVSTEKQFLANQKEEILRFAEKNGLAIDKWYTETVSGSAKTGAVVATDEAGRYADCYRDFKIKQDTIGDYDYFKFMH